MNWPLARIDQLAETGTGGTPLRKEGERFFGGAIPWIKSGELRDSLLTSAVETITDEALAESNAKLVPPGAVLIALYGATVGKTALLGFEATTNQAVCHIVPDRRLAEPRFVWYALRAELPELLRKRVGGAQPNISQQIIRSTKLPLPATREQRRIVELLEQADALRRQRAEADQLADRILPALFCHFFGEPTANPKHWPTSPLHKLADFVSGATPSKEIPEFWDGTIPWVSPKDMKMPELRDAIDHVSDKALRDTNLKLIPSDTVLIVVRGMILAHTVPVCLARVPVTINQDMKALSVKGDATAEFLQWALLTQQTVLLRLVTIAAHGTRKLDTGALGALEIPIPPPGRKDLIEKWTAIVREQQAAARQRANCGEAVERMWRVMLHRAFTGELTSKWREAHLKELLAEMEQQARLLRAVNENN